MPLIALLLAIDPPNLNFAAEVWETIKGAIMTLTLAGVFWLLKTVRELLALTTKLTYIVIGPDGKNGLRGDVSLLVRRVGAIEDRNIAIDAVVEAERQRWPHADRRTGARRMKDVVHEAQDERLRRITDEHPIDQEDRP